MELIGIDYYWQILYSRIAVATSKKKPARGISFGNRQQSCTAGAAVEEQAATTGNRTRKPPGWEDMESTSPGWGKGSHWCLKTRISPLHSNFQRENAGCSPDATLPACRNGCRPLSGTITTTSAGGGHCPPCCLVAPPKRPIPEMAPHEKVSKKTRRHGATSHS